MSIEKHIELSLVVVSMFPGTTVYPTMERSVWDKQEGPMPKPIYPAVSRIDQINAKIAERYQPGAYQWIDDHMNNAWTKATDRFEKAIMSGENIDMEGETYFDTVMRLLDAYLENRPSDTAQDVVNTIQMEFGI